MIRRLLATLLLAAAGTAGAAEPLQPVADLDINRYSGTWYEIARLPNRFEDQCVGDITATYTPLQSGRIRVVNACRNARGEMESVDGQARRQGDNPAKLEVRFAPAWLGWLPFVWADYWVVDLDEDYRWAIVGEPGRKYLWFLTRDRAVDQATFDELKARAEALGFKLDKLVVVTPPTN